MTQKRDSSQEPMIWANLLHLSYNMWEDRVATEYPIRGYRPYLRFDEQLWRPTLEEFRQHHMEAVELVGRAMSDTTT